MSNTIELRSSILEASEDGELFVSGTVNKTETWSGILGKKRKFREKVKKGVFSDALKEASRVDFLAEHDKNQLLSSTENDSLKLWEDDIGLKMEATIAPTSYGRDTYALIKSNLKNYMSFGFKVLEDSWDIGQDGIYERTIEKIVLREVSTVRNPAYAASIIEARGIDVAEDVAENIKIRKGKDNMSNIEKINFMDKNIEKTLNNSKKVNSGFTLYETIFSRINNSELLKLCQNSIADSNTGRCIFPIVNDKDISYIEIKAEGIECAKQASDILVNADESFVDKIKVMLDNNINTEIENKLCKELNKIEPLEITIENDCEKIEELFIQLNNKYLGENFILCNTEDYKKLLKLKNAVGDSIVQFNKGNNGIYFPNTSTRTIRAYINHTPILVNNTMECVALFTPEYIGISHLELHTFKEVITTNLKRSGKREWLALAGAGVKILDKKSVVCVKI